MRPRALLIANAIVSRINLHRPPVLRFGSWLKTPCVRLVGFSAQTRSGACTAMEIRKWSEKTSLNAFNLIVTPRHGLGAV
jgi:hypothetical protein